MCSASGPMQYNEIRALASGMPIRILWFGYDPRLDRGGTSANKPVCPVSFYAGGECFWCPAIPKGGLANDVNGDGGNGLLQHQRERLAILPAARIRGRCLRIIVRHAEDCPSGSGAALRRDERVTGPRDPAPANVCQAVRQAHHTFPAQTYSPERGRRAGNSEKTGVSVPRQGPRLSSVECPRDFGLSNHYGEPVEPSPAMPRPLPRHARDFGTVPHNGEDFDRAQSSVLVEPTRNCLKPSRFPIRLRLGASRSGEALPRDESPRRVIAVEI